MSDRRQSDGRRLIPSLDGLRTVSVLLVIAGHLRGTAGYPINRVTLWLGQFAHLGVQIFFVISGFLITTLLVREYETNGRVDLVQFYLRRTYRIFPAAFFYISVMALVARPRDLWYAYTYMMCYADQSRPWVLGHLWSLSVEEQFYLLWPGLLVLGFRYRKKMGYAVLLLAPLARLGFWMAGMREIDEYFPAVADSLMMGSLLAFSHKEVLRRLPWLRHWWVLAGLGISLLTWVPAVLSRVRANIFLGGLAPLLIAAMLLSAVERADWILNNRVTAFLGILSYSLYLWQQPFLNRGMRVWWTAFPANLLLAFACALVSYFVVERPVLRWYRGRIHRAENLPLRTAA